MRLSKAVNDILAAFSREAHGAMEHVAAANYPERRDEAAERINRALLEAEAKVKHLIFTDELKREYKKGIEAAASMLEFSGLNRTSSHPWLLSDCIRAKFNQLPKSKVRKAPKVKT